LIAGDGHDGYIADIVQNVAGRIWEITRQDPRKKLGIQFILVTTDRDVVKAFAGSTILPLTNTTFEADIVDVTTLTQINEMGGIDSLLCQATILGGALSEPLDNMLKDMENTQK